MQFTDKVVLITGAASRSFRISPRPMTTSIFSSPMCQTPRPEANAMRVDDAN